ncbi:MAG: hypothetical protein H6718_26350 [Polyangiaceae bacterium]|nr:hypothetical protein [Myxococcales bacterium]MCB9588961.1 hypothetical protein [Polyangiaceae bacterium]MCB9609261.1 hypothetical protein [Polyangiaceae bacterium]
MSSRLHAEHLQVGSSALEAGRVRLTSPGVGLVRGLPRPGALVTAGQRIGELVVLGKLVILEAPQGVHGIVSGERRRTYAAKLPVGFGDALLELEPVTQGDLQNTEAAAGASLGLVFRAPTSGRFYTRPGPDQDVFVAGGQEIQTGHNVCLLEVMKTFNRIAYGGDGLPAKARVVRILPADGDDVEQGDPLLELEAVE